MADCLFFVYMLYANALVLPALDRREQDRRRDAEPAVELPAGIGCEIQRHLLDEWIEMLFELEYHNAADFAVERLWNEVGREPSNDRQRPVVFLDYADVIVSRIHDDPFILYHGLPALALQCADLLPGGWVNDIVGR